MSKNLEPQEGFLRENLSGEGITEVIIGGSGAKLSEGRKLIVDVACFLWSQFF